MHFIDGFCRKLVKPLPACLAMALLVAGCATQAPEATPPGAGVVQPVAAERRASNIIEYQILAARRIQAANPQLSFSGPLPDPLASIPVLLVHLNADGTVSKMDVLRVPRYHKQTVELAKQAVLRAQPFGPVAHLPKPWRFSETFLFNDDLRFRLRTLVEIGEE